MNCDKIFVHIAQFRGEAAVDRAGTVPGSETGSTLGRVATPGPKRKRTPGSLRTHVIQRGPDRFDSHPLLLSWSQSRTEPRSHPTSVGHDSVEAPAAKREPCPMPVVKPDAAVNPGRGELLEVAAADPGRVGDGDNCASGSAEDAPPGRIRAGDAHNRAVIRWSGGPTPRFNTTAVSARCYRSTRDCHAAGSRA